jgi:hypothetical protein
MTHRLAALAAVLLAWGSAAQAEAPASATDFTKADFDTMIGVGPVDHQAKVVDAGRVNVGISVVNRKALNNPPGAPVTGLLDTHLAKIYTIVSGSGVLVTGGKIVDAKALPDDKDDATTIGGALLAGANEGGTARMVGPGDVVVIPMGVFAGWQAVPDHVY